MSGVKFWTLTVFIVCLNRWSVYAGLTKEELATMKEINMPYVEECSKEQDISLDNLKETLKNTEGFNCFFACFLKKIEGLNKNGMVEPGKISEYIRSFIKTEETLNAMDNVINDCSKVNDAEVTDGSEGCDRAKLMFDCLQEHKEEMM